ncbi:MAG: hypothetical protein LBC53_07035 [Spirochaetaceae bacterium]|nr:hypothetical protein [Spirochaetaceae bacterium]
MLRILLFAVFLFAFLPLVIFLLIRWFKFLYSLIKKELKPENPDEPKIRRVED